MRLGALPLSNYPVREKTHHGAPQASQEHTMTAAHKYTDVYAQQLVEVLSDAVDILNEAKADGIILQFQISQGAPDGKYALTSLTATQPIIPAPQPAVPASA